MHFLCFGFVKHASYAIETKTKNSFFPRKMSYHRNGTSVKYEFHLEPYF